MDGGAWWGTVHGSQRVGHDFTFTFTFMMEKNLLVENIRANKGICLNFRQSNVKIRLKKGLRFFSALVSIFSGRELLIRKNSVILLVLSNEHLECSSWTQAHSPY